MTAETVDAIVAEAEKRASVAEVAAADERRKQREQDRITKATADADAADALAAENVLSETVVADEVAVEDSVGAPPGDA